MNPGDPPDALKRLLAEHYGTAVKELEEELLVKFSEIVRSRSPEAWQLLHVSALREIVHCAIKRLRPNRR